MSLVLVFAALAQQPKSVSAESGANDPFAFRSGSGWMVQRNTQTKVCTMLSGAGIGIIVVKWTTESGRIVFSVNADMYKNVSADKANPLSIMFIRGGRPDGVWHDVPLEVTSALGKPGIGISFTDTKFADRLLQSEQYGVFARKGSEDKFIFGGKVKNMLGFIALRDCGLSFT